MVMAVAPRQRLSEVNPNGVTYFMEKLIGKIYEHFDDDYLTDVTFKLTNPAALISAHRLILSSASEYFRELFRSDESSCPEIEISAIDSDTFERLITFCYTGKVLITTENMEKMLNAAVILKLDDAVAECTDFVLDHISYLSLARLYSLGGATQCEIIKQKVLEYQIKNFIEIVENQEFLNFDAKNVQKIIERDDLNIQREEDAFKAIKRWYEHDPPARKHQLPDLISCLRLTQFGTDFLRDHIQPLPNCEDIVLETIAWAHCPRRREQIALKFTKPRMFQLNYSQGTAFLALHIGDGEGKIFQYNTDQNSWHKCFDIKLDVKYFKASFVDKNLIFTGGWRDLKSVADVRSWSFETKKLRQLPSMKESRSFHCVVTLNNKMYVIGGLDAKKKVLKSVECYTRLTGWTSISDMITERSQAGAVILDGKIYVMGGMNANYSVLNTVECYDPKTDCWTQCADMNEGRFGLGVAVHRGEIYAVGGCNNGTSKSVESYYSSQNEWTMVCSLNDGDGEDIYAISISYHQLWSVGGVDSNRVSVYTKKSMNIIDKDYVRSEKGKMPLAGPYYCFTAPKCLL